MFGNISGMGTEVIDEELKEIKEEQAAKNNQIEKTGQKNAL